MLWIIFAVVAFFVMAIMCYKLTEDTDYEGFAPLLWLPALGVGVFNALGLWLIGTERTMAGQAIILVLVAIVVAIAIWQARRFVEIILAIVLVGILLLGMPMSAMAADFMPHKSAKQTEVDATAEALEKIADNTETIADNTANFGISGTADTTELSIDTVGHWIHFYNLDLTGTDDQFNFGPKPTGCSSAADYDKEFRERLKKDPALAAAATAWLDANVGTRYLGVFYESCKEDWAETINAAKDDFAADQMDFYHDLDAFFAFIDTAEVSVRDCKDVTDQMYMNPFTPSGIPDVIVFETTDQSGQELVYTFNIKGNKVEVAFRIDCGYQPTNVAEIMKITPQKKPEAKKSTTTTTTKKSTTTKKKTTPEKTPDPTPTPTPTPTPDPDPDPDPDPTPEYNKDPNKAPKENTEPNDDPGPGENTNNGEGATESTKDQPTNSNHYDSYDDYQKDIEGLKGVNETQKTGGDSNEPSTPAPTKDTKVDSNADKGTGSGGIDTPTQTQKPATEAGTGNAINDSPGEAWEGPAD